MTVKRIIPGGWKDEIVVVGGQRFHLQMPANPDAVFSYLEAHPDAAAELGDDPYWTEVWPTAVRMAEDVVNAAWPPGLKAIELGCGIGLVGLAALARGMHVTLSDNSLFAVEIAVENARRNGFSAVEGLVLDWRTPPQRSYDVILASDVIYDVGLHRPLLATLQSLSHAGTEIWIGDCGRGASAAFLAEANQQWSVTTSDDGSAETYQRIRLKRLDG
jgi:predicted nicotinamide N-methyase